MKYNEEYIEALISIIELNKDKYWLSAFTDLRIDKDLPGGGAGSLNDWSPQYETVEEKAWYGVLYRLLKEWYIPIARKAYYDFFTYQKSPKIEDYNNRIKYAISLRENESISNAENFIIAKCSECNYLSTNRYNVEKVVAKLFFAGEIEYIEKHLSKIVLLENSIQSEKAYKLRLKLNEALIFNGVHIEDYSKVCKNCYKETQRWANHFKISESDNKFDLTLIAENVSYYF